MSDVEFLEPEPPAGAADDPRWAPGMTARWSLAHPDAAPVLAAAGVACAVAAPFAVVSRVSAPFLADAVFDGWGRSRDGAGALVGHGPLFGVVTCAAAGLVLVGVLLWWFGRRPRLARAAIGAAAGALAATAALAVLTAFAAADSVRAASAEVDVDAIDTDGRPIDIAGSVSMQLGWFTWWCAAAAVLLVAALLAKGYADSSRTGDPSSQASTSDTASP